jgi:hypothetical protein
MASVTRAKERSVVWHLWQDNDGINRNSYRTYLQTLVSSDKTVVLNILSMIKQRFSTSFRLTIEQKMYEHGKCNLPMRKSIWLLRVFQAAKITLRTNFNYLLSLVGNHCLQLFSFFFKCPHFQTFPPNKKCIVFKCLLCFSNSRVNFYKHFGSACVLQNTWQNFYQKNAEIKWQNWSNS